MLIRVSKHTIVTPKTQGAMKIHVDAAVIGWIGAQRKSWIPFFLFYSMNKEDVLTWGGLTNHELDCEKSGAYAKASATACRIIGEGNTVVTVLNRKDRLAAFDWAHAEVLCANKWAAISTKEVTRRRRNDERLRRCNARVARYCEWASATQRLHFQQQGK